MDRTLDVQTFGSMIVVGAFAAAEAAAALLDWAPGSPLLWSLNLSVFRIFEQARAEPSSLRFLFHPASLLVAVGLLALIGVFRLRRLRFALALSANLGFAAAVALACAQFGDAPSRSASTLVVALDRGPDVLALGAILLAAFAAFATSHVSFLRAIRIDLRAKGEGE